MRISVTACSVIIVILAFLTAWYSIRVNDLQTQVDTLQTEKTSLQTKTDNFEAQIYNLQNQINDVTNTLGNLTVDTHQFRSLDLGLYNINSGLFHNFYVPDMFSPVFVSGYGRLSVYFTVEDVTPGNFTMTVSLNSIVWWNSLSGNQTFEFVYSPSRTVFRNSQGFTTTYPQQYPS